MKPDWENFLLHRWLAVNAVGVFLLALAAANGWVTVVANADSTGIVWVILLLFVYGMFTCGQKILHVSKEINHVRSGELFGKYKQYQELLQADSKFVSNIAEAVKIKLFGRIAYIRYVASSLVMLGLVGTVIGFIIALGGVDPATASQASSVVPMIATLISGMSVALYTTLVGSLLNLWMMLNYNMLASGMANLVAYILETVPNEGTKVEKVVEEISNNV